MQVLTQLLNDHTQPLALSVSHDGSDDDPVVANRLIQEIVTAVNFIRATSLQAQLLVLKTREMHETTETRIKELIIQIATTFCKQLQVTFEEVNDATFMATIAYKRE